MKSNIDKPNKEAIEAFIKDFPNSVVSDLLMYFGEDVVVRFVELYSGQKINIPSVNSIWISYRNRKVVEELDKKNTKEVREMLADNFGLEDKEVTDIYAYCKGKHITRVKHTTINRIVDVIFRKNLRKYHKAVMKMTQGASTDSTQDPEILYLVEEAKREFLSNCMEDLNEHLVICGRKDKRDKCVELLMKKIDEDI